MSDWNTAAIPRAATAHGGHHRPLRTNRRPTGEEQARLGGGPLVTAALLVITAALAALWVLPLLWAVLTSVKPEGETTAIPLRWLPSQWTLDAYRRVLGAGDILRWMTNSLVTATLTTVLVVPLFAEMVSLNLVDTYWGIILPQVVAPAMVYILVRFFQALPKEVEEAAVIDGASRWLVFWRIVLPLSRPVLAAVAIFTFISTWNNFLWPFVVTTDPGTMTLPVGLSVVQGTFGLRYAQIMASTVLATLPLLIVFVVFQRQIVRGVAHTGLSGQ